LDYYVLVGGIVFGYGFSQTYIKYKNTTSSTPHVIDPYIKLTKLKQVYIIFLVGTNFGNFKDHQNKNCFNESNS